MLLYGILSLALYIIINLYSSRRQQTTQRANSGKQSKLQKKEKCAAIIASFLH